MNLTISEIIDVPTNQKLLDSFCDSVGIAAAIIDLDGNVIIGSRWQRICTDFHRENDLSREKCIESDTKLANYLKEGEKYSLYRCQNGLNDAASPIIVQDQHIANAFVGQFLTDSPDLDFFKQQAIEYGFDVNAYLQALSEVPVIDEKKIPVIINFLVSYAEILADIVIKHETQLHSERQLNKATQEIESRKAAAAIIETDRNRLLSILDGIDDVIYVADPETYELLHVNDAFKANWGNDVIGKKCYMILQDRDDPCPFCSNNKIFGENIGKTYVWEFQNEVDHHWYRCSDKAIRWIDNRWVRLEIATDITEEKIFRQQQIRMEKLSALGQVSAGVAHELNNPLMGVLNYAQYCRSETSMDDERYEVLKDIETETKRCVEIVGHF